jgi:hypothetical protein
MDAASRRRSRHSPGRPQRAELVAAPLEHHGGCTQGRGAATPPTHGACLPPRSVHITRRHPERPARTAGPATWADIPGADPVLRVRGGQEMQSRQSRGKQVSGAARARAPSVFFERKDTVPLSTFAPSPRNPDHHLWRNGRLWRVAFTVHLPGWQKERVRLSRGRPTCAPPAPARRSSNATRGRAAASSPCVEPRDAPAIAFRRRPPPEPGCKREIDMSSTALEASASAGPATPPATRSSES